jgi:hypothetical protein
MGIAYFRLPIPFPAVPSYPLQCLLVPDMLFCLGVLGRNEPHSPLCFHTYQICNGSIWVDSLRLVRAVKAVRALEVRYHLFYHDYYQTHL